MPDNNRSYHRPLGLVGLASDMLANLPDLRQSAKARKDGAGDREQGDEDEQSRPDGEISADQHGHDTQPPPDASTRERSRLVHLVSFLHSPFLASAKS